MLLTVRDRLSQHFYQKQHHVSNKKNLALYLDRIGHFPLKNYRSIL